jgi:outer membrane protein assembly factor BamB
MRRPAVLALLLALAAPAAALADATSSQQGPSHDGAADGPGPPLGKRWERPVGGTVGTPLVAEGRVFVVTGEGSASSSSSSTETAQLRALALDSGRELWARAVERGSNGLPVGLAYDGGRVLALENGAVRAYDAASGALAWTVRPAGEEPEEGSSTRRGPRFTSIPVAAGGTVYVIGTTPPGPSGPPGPGLPVGPTQPRPAPSPLSLFQLRLSDGAVTRLSGYGGPDGDSTVHGVGLDGERAYVSAGCGDAEAFDRASGERRWTKGVTTSSGSSSSSCSSSGFGLLPSPARRSSSAGAASSSCARSPLATSARASARIRPLRWPAAWRCCRRSASCSPRRGPAG